MQLTKAYLEARDQDVPNIEFMFNPTNLSFKHEVVTSEEKGAEDEGGGRPKVSFSYIRARTITISDIVFDTYEEREDVRVYIHPFLCAVEFIKHVKEIKAKVEENLKKKIGTRASSGGSKSGQNDKNTEQRIPVYRFMWGEDIEYLPYCVIESLEYKLTKFLPDGTPVRAMIDTLTIKETDIRPQVDLSKVVRDRMNDGLGRLS